MQSILLSKIDATNNLVLYAKSMSKRYWYQVASERRKAKGITYDQIAAALNVNKSTVGHWFTGRNRPLFDTIREIAKVLDITVAELISEDPYFLTDEIEREFINYLRETPPAYRAQLLKVVAAYQESFANEKKTNSP